MDVSIHRVETLLHKITEYENAIRRHRNESGDDRCWMDDEELYKILPEGYTPPKRDSCVMLINCQRYIQSRQNPKTDYVSPQRHIEELELELGQVKKLCDQMDEFGCVYDPEGPLLSQAQRVYEHLAGLSGE